MKSLNNFDDYIKGNMSEDQMDQFTGKILGNHYDGELKDKWNKILNVQHQDATSAPTVTPIDAKTTKIRTLYKAVAFAAGFLLLLGMYFMNFESVTGSQPNLAAVHLEAPFPFSEIRKGALDMSVRRKLAGEEYSLQAYDQAIKGYEKVIALDGGKPADFFYLGLSYLYSDNVQQSIVQFHQVLENNGDRFKKEATWFLSLAYLKIDNNSDAKIYLNKVSAWSESSDARGWDKKIAKQASLILEKMK